MRAGPVDAGLRERPAVVAAAGRREADGHDQAAVGVDDDLKVGRVPVVLARGRDGAVWCCRALSLRRPDCAADIRAQETGVDADCSRVPSQASRQSLLADVGNLTSRPSLRTHHPARTTPVQSTRTGRLGSPGLGAPPTSKHSPAGSASWSSGSSTSAPNSPSATRTSPPHAPRTGT